jgi:uncharacterized repeat protein (TIGR01451 family)
MTRRWFALASSFVLVTILVSAARAQESGSRSIFGYWFGKRDNSSQQTKQQTNNSNSSSSGRSIANGDNAPFQSPRTANNSKNQLPPDPAATQSDALPGLGGAPLPSANNQNAINQKTNNGPAANGNTASSASPQSNPSSRMSGRNMNALANRRPGVRQLDVSAPNGTPAIQSSPQSTPTTSSSRQSPNRRTAPHVTPEDLRRELSSSFGNSNQNAESTPHTARAAEGTITPGTPLNSQNMTEPIATEMSAGSGQPMSPAVEPANPATDKSTNRSPSLNQPKQEIAVEREPQSAAEAFGNSKDTHKTGSGSSFVRTPYSNTLPAGTQTTRGKEAFGDALQVAGGGDPNVLASNQTPVLTADIRGPKQILIGRESLYRVRLQNQSDVPAEGIVATIRIPTGADVVNSTATQGMVQQLQDAQAKGQLQWQLARLDRHANETLELRLIPRDSRPMELGITWTVAPVGSRAIVEVQEPKLQLEISGPNEVYYDRPQVFKLTLSNPGTGPAENVKIELMPLAGKDKTAKEAPSSHPLGDLPPGGTQTVEVELTAREAGKMAIKAAATAEGGLKCDASKDVFCRKPELEVDWRGPATKYAGTLATYFFRVRNPGTAPAEDVTLRASLPEGAEFVSASEGQLFDTKAHEVLWRVGTLRPGDDNYMELKCVLKAAGSNQLKITAATATGTLADTKTAATNVIALADLKLEVVDPSGPVAVGSPAMYEIHIKNRGANSAKDINVVGMFSEGIEPETAEGAMYTVADGRVSFKTIDDLAPGRDVVLRIRAHAVQPGTHMFRAEVLCRDLEIKLAADETTRFYADDENPDGKPQKQATGGSEAFKSTVR